MDAALFPPALRTAHELVIAGIAMRRTRAKEARAALTRGQGAARQAGIPALTAEVESACRMLDAPAFKEAIAEARAALANEPDQLRRLDAAIKSKGNPVCVGLDPRFESLPAFIRDAALREHGNSPRTRAEAMSLIKGRD